jgi:hypothetical protein
VAVYGWIPETLSGGRRRIWREFSGLILMEALYRWESDSVFVECDVVNSV